MVGAGTDSGELMFFRAASVQMRCVERFAHADARAYDMNVAIRRLDPVDAARCLDGLADLLIDATEGGASVGFLAGLSRDQATAFWRGVLDDPHATLLAAFDHEGRVMGSVVAAAAAMPNQPHRADIRKLLVLRSARRRGIAARLMAAAEDSARAAGRTLLVLDTAAGSEAEQMYPKLGWTRCGVIPDYAQWPDGRFCDTVVFFKRLEAPV